MKKHIKSLSLLIVIFMILQMLTVGVFASDVATYSTTLVGNATGYDSADDVDYVKVGDYVANWGARGEVSTFLTTYALNFYKTGDTFDVVSALAGGTNETNAHNSALYDALQDIMVSAHDYETSYNATRDLFKYTDCVNGNYSAGISSFYSGDKIGPAWDGGSTWNREHCWPNSKGDMSGNGENDIMMLRPTASSENGSRGNKAYGSGGSYYNPNSESGGALDLRGDVARIVLYTYVRWGCTSTQYNGNSTIVGTNGVIESIDLLLTWIEIDPVDTWELGRNDAVESITGTRNVFVDYPEYAYLLFGEEIPVMYTPSGIAAGGEVPPPPAGGDQGGDVEEETTPTFNAVKPVVGTAYKFGMEQTNAGKTVYLIGGMDGYYMATSDNMDAGLDFYIEQTNGGYYMYYMNGSTKTYVNMVVSGTHVNGAYSTTAETVYTYDETLKTFAAEINGGTYVFGTRGDKTYTTIGPVATTYADNFHAHFVSADGSVGDDDIGGTTPPEETTTKKPEETTTATPVTPPVTGEANKVSKTHTQIAEIAGVTVGQTTGIISDKQIKLDNNITIVAAKGSGGTDPTIFSESIRLYQNGNTLTIKAAAGYELSTVKLSLADHTAGRGPISVTGGIASALTSGAYTITANDGATEIVITTTGTDKTTRVYVANIEVVYAPAGGSEGGDDIGGGTTPEDNTTNAPVNPPVEDDTTNTPVNPPVEDDTTNTPVNPPVEDDTTNTPVNPPEEETTVPTTPSTPSGSLTVGGQYKIGMNQTAAGKVVYLNGEIDGYYLDTTENINSALVFVIEEANGGYYVSTTINGAKKYLNMVVSGTHVNAVYEDAPSTVYTYDETLKTLIGIVDGNQYVFGTRNDKTYTTIGANKLSYEPFMIFLSKVESGTPGGDDDNQGGTGEEGTTAPGEEGTTAPGEEGTTAPGEEGTTAPDEEGTTAPDEEGTTAPDEEPTTEPTTEPSTEPVTEPTTEAPTEEVTTATPDGASTDVTGDTPTDEGNSDEGKGCKSSISGISAVIIAIAVPMFLYRKKKED